MPRLRHAGPVGAYGGPALVSGGTRTFTIWGQCGVPTNATAVTMNVTVPGAGSDGSLKIFPSDVSQPNATVISFMAGRTRANNSIGKLSASGQVNVFNTSAVDTHAILDVSGYFLASPSYRQSFFYSPEMHLLSETGTSISSPAPATEYVWFGGRPVAQESVTSPSAVKYLVSDHLGTPFLATGSTPAITWRVEYEPFGSVYGSPRAGAASDVRLRLPGQEYRETSPGRNYNVFRWYRPDVGQYTQPDPLLSVPDLGPRLKGLFDTGELNPYLYARGNPTVFRDPLGLCSVCDDCPSGEWTASAVPVFSAVFATPWGAVGGSRAYATLRCKDNGKTVEVETRCRAREGAYVGASAGFSGTPFGAAGACGCNVKDLLSPSVSSSLSLAIFAWDRGPCSMGGHTNAFGVGLSLRGGVAQFDCETILKGTQVR